MTTPVPSGDAPVDVIASRLPPPGSRFSAQSRADAVRALASTPFNVLVVGGGITGAGIARDAAMRGLSVALVEREDFGSGTSSRSSRLIHGGLRYLEHGHLRLVFESSRERRVLARIAPHLVRPLAFTWPVYENARVPGWKLRAGLMLYDALALFRNIGSHETLGPGELAAREPELRQQGLRGGACYYDAATDDARLTLANARAAAEAGAVVANYVELRELLTDGGDVRGAVAVDMLNGERIHITAGVVVNATGPWSDVVTRLADPGSPAAVRGTKGVHIAVPRERVGNRGALTILSPIDGRVMFILPAGTLTIVGTTETDYDGPLDNVHATADDVTYLLRSVNAYFPAAHLGGADVVSAWAGIRPLVGGNGDPGRASREHAIMWTARGLLTVSGGKLTTYRVMAAQAVNAVVRALTRPGSARRTMRNAPTDTVPLPGGTITALEAEIQAARAAVGTRDVAEHLVGAYGSEWRAIWAIVQHNPALGAPITPALPYIVAELHHAIASEMAVTLSDLLIRRLHVAYETRDHGRSAAPAVARVVAPILGWHAEQMERELAAYEQDVVRMFGIEEAGTGD